MTRTLCEHMQSLFPDIAPDSDHIGSGQYSGEQRDHYTSTSRPMVSAQQAFSRRLAKYLLDEKFRQSVELGPEIDLVGVTHDATPVRVIASHKHATGQNVCNLNPHVSRIIPLRDAITTQTSASLDHAAILQDQHGDPNEKSSSQNNHNVAHHG